MNKGQFKKGQGRSPNAGRKKGTPNKKREAILEVVAREGEDPLIVLARQTKSPDEDKRIYAAVQLMPYCHPKLSAIEISEDPESPVGDALADKHLAKLKELHVAAAKERKK
jgi:hypothetical protein